MTQKANILLVDDEPEILEMLNGLLKSEGYAVRVAQGGEEALSIFKQEGADVVIGSRALKTSNVELHQPWYRETMGRTFNIFVKLIVMHGFKDTQCGFKLFSAKAAQEVFPRLRLQGFSFDVEALYIAKKFGFSIKEVGVRWINSPASRVHPIRDASKMFIDLVRIRTGL